MWVGWGGVETRQACTQQTARMRATNVSYNLLLLFLLLLLLMSQLEIRVLNCVMLAATLDSNHCAQRNETMGVLTQPLATEVT